MPVPCKRVSLWTLLVLGLASAPLLAAEPTETLVCTGVAKRQDDGKLHANSREVQKWQGGRILSSTTVWTDATGKTIARQSERHGDNAFVPEARYEDLRTGLLMETGPAPGGKARLALREGKDAKVEHKVVEPDGRVVGMGGLDPFMRATWADIEAGKAVEFSLLAPSRLEWYRFRLRKLGDAQLAGRRVVKVAVEPRNALIRTLAGDLVLTWDPAAASSVAFRGRDSVDDADGDGVAVSTSYHCVRAPAAEPAAAN